jgi:hypothetical protein
LCRPSYGRFIDPPDYWGAGIDVGNVYTSVSDGSGAVNVPAMPLPRWISLERDSHRWRVSNSYVQLERSAYIERLTEPPYHVETARVRLDGRKWFDLAVVGHSASIRPVATSIFNSIRVERSPGERAK